MSHTGEFTSNNTSVTNQSISQNLSDASPSICQNLPDASQSISQNLPDVSPSISQNLPDIRPSISHILPNVRQSISQNLPDASPSTSQNLPVVSPSISQNLPEAIQSISQNLPDASPTASETGHRLSVDPAVTEKSRKRVIRLYCAISMIQIISGLIAFTCASISVHYSTGKGFPYFVGSFAIGGTLLISSLVAFRVYNKGTLYSTCREARKEVLCAINWHRGLSFFMFFIHVFGLAIIWMYGLCVMDETECSYDDYINSNKTLAIASFVVGCVGLVSSALGVVLMRKFGSAFGLRYYNPRRGAHRHARYRDNVLSRQNGEMQRQGCTNFGFEALTPPPYSPRDIEISIVSNIFPNISSCSYTVYGGPPKYSDLEITVLPGEAPPPYKETADAGSEETEENTHL